VLVDGLLAAAGFYLLVVRGDGVPREAADLPEGPSTEFEETDDR